MNLEGIEQQKSRQLELPWGRQSEALRSDGSVEILSASQRTENLDSNRLMEKVVERENARKAYRRVKKNKGSPGVDGISVKELQPYMVKHWKEIREQLLQGTYKPSPVKRVEIPKPNGGVRQLGIPTVLDRVIQQAILQVLQPKIEPTFSDHSYGFRPKRSAHGAIRRAQGYIEEGRTWVVDVDLEKFFDRVNHDVLMGRLAKRIGDKRVLRTIRRYLQAGMMADGVVMERWEGTPQGGPLSPMLGNFLLDEVDKKLERRGHAFVRYADDSNVYVRTERAGKRVMKSLEKEYRKLRLRMNKKKSKVQRVWESAFLGYGFQKGRGGKIRKKIAEKSLEAMKGRVRKMTPRLGGRSLGQMAEKLGPYLRGWKGYYQMAEVKSTWVNLDKWIRRRMRAIQLRQWRYGTTAYKKVRAMGHGHDVAAMAASIKGSWWKAAKSRGSNIVMPKSYFIWLGVPTLAK